MASAKDIVEEYFTAFWKGEKETARRCLGDDLSFSAPAAAFRGADRYLRATDHVRHGVKDVEQQRVFVDDSDVCLWYSLFLDGPVSSVAIAEWYHVDDGKIVSIRTLLDTAPFTARPQTHDHRGDTAVDPVCHMTVEKAPAAATRVFAGSTYYFCNVGCAQSFELEPKRYL